MNVRNLLLDAMARGLRIGHLEFATASDVMRFASGWWRVSIGAGPDAPVYSVRIHETDRADRIDCSIRRCGHHPDDEYGSILVDPSDPHLATHAAQFFGELAGRRGSGWDGMDEYYPADGIGLDTAACWYPFAVEYRASIGRNRR